MGNVEVTYILKKKALIEDQSQAEKSTKNDDYMTTITTSVKCTEATFLLGSSQKPLENITSSF